MHTAGTGRECTENIDLGKEFKVLARPGGGGLHEVFPLLVQSGDLKDVQNIMHVELSKPMGHHRTSQVGMAVVIERFSTHKQIDIRVTACSQEVMAPSSILGGPEGCLTHTVLINQLVQLTTSQRIARYRHKWPQVWQIGPEAIPDGHMRRVDLTRASSPESLPGVLRIPDVQVSNLRAFGGRETADMAGWHDPCLSGTWTDSERCLQRTLRGIRSCLRDGSVDGGGAVDG